MADEVKGIEGCTHPERNGKHEVYWCGANRYQCRACGAEWTEAGDTHRIGLGGLRTELSLDEIRALLLSQGLHIVGEADWAVLEAMGKIELCAEDPDEDPLEPQEYGEDCFIYTDDQYAIAKAEVARRAAKGE